MINLSRSQTSIDRQVGHARHTLIEEINAAVGVKRESYITTLSGQELIYLAKEHEARAYLAADPEPTDLAGYPFLKDEVGVTAETPYQLAQIWLYMSQEWRVIAAGLEQIRMSLISQAESATTMTQIARVRASFEEALST